MSTVLTPEGEPWGLVYRPVDGERRSADEVASRLVNRLDVTEARRIGATLAAEDDAVVRAAVEALIASDLDRSITLVGWLRMGTTDLEPQHRERVHRDLHRAAIVDRPPSWMPPEIAAAARRHPVPEPKTP